ncbi:hypothetical protein [Streptomyces sp. NRRL S-495]|uniref:hypothetical protein n=1 Tax=Streptomyces sp. NRRL S-495 TaxID=1609133 RepID=UPI0006963DBE|nr:hypothetical protein [Streptomyces sp. NRRL S-495]
MKYRTEKRQVPAVHANGTPITRTETVRVPVLPRDWDRIALRAAVGLVLGLTLVSVIWSTVSIGALLQGGVGYAAAVIFDVAWAVCLILEWMARYEPDKRAFPQKMGWGLLVATMLAIGAHGALLMHSWPAAIVGGAVSLFAKALWLGVLQHIDRDLSPDDQALVQVEKSRAYATLALSSTRRQVTQVEQMAALQLLAMEQDGYAFQAAVPVEAEVVPAATRSAETLQRAAQALRTDADPNAEVDPATVAALEEARADGWSMTEVWQTIRPATVASGYPDGAVSAQVSPRAAEPAVRFGFGSPPNERVPEQGGGGTSGWSRPGSPTGSAWRRCCPRWSAARSSPRASTERCANTGRERTTRSTLITQLPPGRST